MHTHSYYESTQSTLILAHEVRNLLLAMTNCHSPNMQRVTGLTEVHTDLFPHLGIPTVWMMYTATWKKKIKKKKKKLKELSDLERENRNTRKCY